MIILVLGLAITLLLTNKQLHKQLLILKNIANAQTGTMTADASGFPLGVYMAGEWLPGRNGIWNTIDWPATDQRLDALQAHHVNAVWLTHVNGAEAGEFARRADARAIRIVASLTDFNCRWDWCKNRTVSEHRAVIDRELTAYGSAPRPLAWGLGDEPDPDAAWDQWVSVWKTYYPNEPITAVFRDDQYPDVCPVGGPCALTFLAMDHYPFFSQNNPYAFYTTGNPYPKNSVQAEAWEWIHHASGVVGRGATPWAMGQTYQEVWGPYKEDSNGGIVIQPGGSSHWITPSEAQVKWQAWTGLAVGAKGIWYYLHAESIRGEPFYHVDSAKNIPSVVSSPINTGSPYGVTYIDGRSTPQFDSLGNVFNHLSSVGPVLRSSIPATSPTVSIVANTANDATALTTILSNQNTSKCWVVVVAGHQRYR